MLVGATLAGPVQSTSAAPTAATYVNPVSKTIPADTFADPSIIRGKDGYWYSYGTSDPLCERTNANPGCADENGDVPHRIPIARSSDLVTWKFAGDAFADPGTAGGNFPSWAEADAGLWGPDIRYVNGQYRLYYVVTETNVTPDASDNAIGMATAPTPVGPWTDSGGPVVGPRRGGPGQQLQMDVRPCGGHGHRRLAVAVLRVVLRRRLGHQADRRRPHRGGRPDDGRDRQQVRGHLCRPAGRVLVLLRLDGELLRRPDDGLQRAGRPVARFARPLHRPRRRLTARVAGRRHPDAEPERQRLDRRRTQRRSSPTSPGQDWIVYHAINRSDPYLNGTDGINERPMLMDRLDWVNGWPYVRDNLGPSDTPQTAPVTGGTAFTRFDAGTTGAFRPSGVWAFPTDTQSGRYADAVRNQSTLTATAPDAHQLRAEADVRGSAGITLGARHDHPRVQVWVASSRSGWRLQAGVTGGPGGSVSAPLPANFNPNAWHSLAVELRGNSVHAELSNARLGDPLATLDLQLRRGLGDAVAGRRGRPAARRRRRQPECA